MLTFRKEGLHCSAGDFFIDPHRAVERALVTHAHSDHARRGCKHYLTSSTGLGLLRQRMGSSASIESVAYGEGRTIGGVRVSFHPAGHILGSAQIRLEYRGEVWVVSGDYKTEPDSTCTPFEPVRCDVFVTESTFGLPIYRWPDPISVTRDLNAWWKRNQENGLTSVILGYSLGKAQRVLAGLSPDIGPIAVHPTVDAFLPEYRRAGVSLPSVVPIESVASHAFRGRGIVVAPPGADLSCLSADTATAFASGWMLVQGKQRGRGADRGFVVSDHCDWPGLMSAIRATEARRIQVMHGFTWELSRWLNENGWEAEAISGPDVSPSSEGEESAGLVP